MLTVLGGNTPPVAPEITSSAPANPVYAVAYSHQYTATGTPPITWSVSVGALPDGLTLDANTGVLSGTPTLNGAYSWTVQVENAAGTDTQAANVTIALALPATNRLSWWDGNSGIYTDTGLTTPAADGELVAAWEDQGVSELHVTQATEADRPVYRAAVTALNNKPAIEFVSSDLLSRNVAAAVVGNINVFTVYVVYVTSTGTTMTLYGEGNSGSATQFFNARLNIGTGAAGAGHRSDANVNMGADSGNVGSSDGVKHLLTVRRIAADSYSVRLDGVEVATSTVAPGTTTINRIAIGALIRNTTGQIYTGHIAQVANYSADNFATIEPLLAAEYGITLP